MRREKRSTPSSTAFAKVDYRSLNAKEKEVYNFHHIGALLAKHGYASYPIRDDWSGGDMFARHMVTRKSLTIQIKGRVTFAKKYLGKDLYIGFPRGDGAIVYPHDLVLAKYLKLRKRKGNPLEDNDAWTTGGLVSWSSPTSELLGLLRGYELVP